MKRWFRRIISIVFAAFGLLFLVIAVEVAIGWHCDLQGQLPSPIAQPLQRQNITAEIPNYTRPEDDTFLSYPEWYIVWSYQEKADFQEHNLPSRFPYFAAVRQYWGSYCCISRLIRGRYPLNFGEHVMLFVIGTSFSAEYILKGSYEKTIGALSEWSSSHEITEEDQFAYKVAREYADFVHVRPFYEFQFAKQVKGLWASTHLIGPHFLRKWERKVSLTADYTVEAFYCWIIEQLTHLSYGFEPSETYAWIDGANIDLLSQVPPLRIIKQVGPTAFIVDIPRYQEFTAVARRLAEHDIQFVEIAGNSTVLVSITASRTWHDDEKSATLLFSQPILTRTDLSRFVLVGPVARLSASLNNWNARAIQVEHVYDY